MDHEARGTTRTQLDQTGQAEEEHGGLKHWGLMLFCCLPMIAIFLLIALGIWNW